ncbi:6088_t:CDS:2, partial [Acaulospora morrowiae]
MSVVKYNSILPIIIINEFKRIFKGLNVGLEISVSNKHSILKLCQPELFTGSSIDKQICSNVDPSEEDQAKISGLLATRGILSFKVQDGEYFHYLVITWVVKTGMMRGRNSVTVSIQDKKPERNNSQELFNRLHVKENKKYPGDAINPRNDYYCVYGGITDGSNAKLEI